MDLDKLCQSLSHATKMVVALIMGTLVVLIFTQVMLRFLFASSLLWIEELGRFMFVWLMFFGISIGVYQNKHIAVTIMWSVLPRPISRTFQWLSILFVGVFFAFLAYKGFEFALINLAGESSVLFIPLGYVYFIMPAASALCVLYSVNALLRFLSGKQPVGEE